MIFLLNLKLKPVFSFWKPPKSFALMVLLVSALSVLLPYVSFAQNVVQGVVKEVGGGPIEGVTVKLKGVAQGVKTNAQGKYSINVANLQVTLSFLHISYEVKDVALNGKSQVNVELTSMDKALNEIVVTGYSTQAKKDITGSVVVVKMDELKSLPASSADHALQGLASGVNVVSSGVPGSSANIKIRGVTSFGDNAPLIIVDGVQQSLINVNTNDIESMQVLKDAGSAAIYGVRGANGVIVVTTKKGKTGKTTIDYDGFYDFKFPLPGNVWDLMNSTDYMNAYNKAYPNNALFSNGMPDYTYRGPSGAGVGKQGDPAVNPNLYFYEKQNTGKNYIIQAVNKDREDWFHNLFKQASTQSHNITASGGSDNAKYLFGMGYMDQEGTLVKTYFKRFSARVNTSFNVGKNIRVGENLNFYHRRQPSFSNQAEFGVISETYKLMPITPLYDIAGNFAGTFGGPLLGSFSNPVANQYRNVEKDLNYDWGVIGNAYGEIDFLKDFTFKTSIGFNVVNSYDQNFTATQTENIQSNTNDNSLSVSSGYGSTMTFTNTLKYGKKLGNHSINVLLGSEAIKYVARSVTGDADKFFSEDPNFLVLGNGTANRTNSSSISSNALYSLFARADYSFMDKYLFGATVRRDGSSVFGPENRYGIFPSFSAGWRISQEGFMKNITWINDFKIKGSWGILGSQNNVSANNAFSLYGSGMGTTYYDITGSSTSIVQGFAQSRIGNQATGWEENVVTNVGFETTLFNNSLSINAEYYNKAINGLLFTEPLPAVILGGATAPTINIGDIKNSGIDASVNYRGKIKSELNFSAGVNITTYNNKVVDIPDPGFFQSGSAQGIGSIAINREGDPVSAFYGYKIVGIFNSAAEVAAAPTQTAAEAGRFRYFDANGDGKITADDRVILGNPNPDFTYGINLGLDYKGFDFSALFYGSQGNEIFNTTLAYLDFMQYYSGAKSNKLLNAWTPTNTNTTVPKIEATSTFSANSTANSYFVEDGSYLRLKSISLGYTFKPTLTKKLGLNRVRVYAQAANLFTITKYSGLDPEIGGAASNFGIDYGNYPNNELNVVFGLNIGF
jgi:TonB-linked SusC/RagA family outer membrane protein